MEKLTMLFPTRSDTNQPVLSQKRARVLKFWIQVEEESYYPSSENKGADQLGGYREADLRLCFGLCRLLVFPWGGSYVGPGSLYYKKFHDMMSKHLYIMVDFHYMMSIYL